MKSGPPFEFSLFSESKLKTCHPYLREVLQAAILVYDFRILEGHRTEEEQSDAFFKGHSKVMWPDSKHNSLPSKAVDIAPYPIDWNDKVRFYFLAGIVKGIARLKGINIRWGGDWDSDGDFKDQTFDDLVHFELIE